MLHDVIRNTSLPPPSPIPHSQVVGVPFHPRHSVPGLLLGSQREVVKLFEGGGAAADIALVIEQAVHVSDLPPLEGVNDPDPVGQGHLVAHDPGQVLQQLVKSPKFLLTHSYHSPLEELVTIYIEFHFPRPFVL